MCEINRIQKKTRFELALPRSKYLLCYCLSFLFAASVLAADDSKDFDFALVANFSDELIRDVMDSEDLVGAGIAMVYRGEQLWSKGYGLASKKNNVPFTNATMSSLHELAKLFTAVGVMQLVEKGQVDLDAPFSRYLPQFTPYVGEEGSKEFTIRELLSHHSGLPAQYSPNFVLERDELGNLPGESASAYRAVLDASQDIAFVSSPGQVFDYSNLGYTLLGILIEEISGLSYHDYMQTKILKPLGMQNTHFGLDELTEVGLSSAFVGSKEQAQRVFRDTPALGLISSVEDMSLFMRALMSGGRGIIGPATLEEMFRSQNDGVWEDQDFRTGLGFALTPIFGGSIVNEKSISQDSVASTARSYFIAFPEHKIAALFTTNTRVSSSVVTDTVIQIVEKTLDTVTDFSPAVFVPHQDIALDAAVADSLVGAYAGVGGAVYIENRRGELRLRIPFMPFLRVNLMPREEGFYGGSLRLFGFLGLGFLPQLRDATRNVEGKVVELNGETYIYVYMNGVSLLTLTKIGPSARGAVFDAWLSRTATYESAIAESNYELKFDEDSDKFLFGPKKRALQLFGEPPELYCLESETELRRCGRGLEGKGIKNVLRITEDGRLLDAYGIYYSLVN